MNAAKKRAAIGIVCCVRDINGHPFHISGEKYALAIRDLTACTPLLIPSIQLHHEVFYHVNGILFTGSPSNIEPHHYQKESRDGTLHDPQRDASTLPLIQYCYEHNIPFMAICRGHQEMNVALGGSLHQHVHEITGCLDHREQEHITDMDTRYGPRHQVTLAPNGLLHKILDKTELHVNSLHTQAIDQLSPLLKAEATAPDGIIEAISPVKPHPFALGLQWHPEWQAHHNLEATKLFQAFGAAVRSSHHRLQ